MMLGVSENGLYPWLAASELGFFFWICQLMEIGNPSVS